MGLRDTSYLFGTIHTIFREDLYITDIVWHAFLNSSVIYFENLRSANPDSARLSLYTMKKLKLKNLLGNICYKMLIERLKSYNDPILNGPAFNRFTPNYMSWQVMENVFGKRLTGVDDSLMALAMLHNKKMMALDGPEVRQRLSDPTPTLDQEATNLYLFLNDFEKNISEYINNLKGFTGKYLAGDIGFLYTRSNFFRVNNNWTGRSFTLRNSEGIRTGYLKSNKPVNLTHLFLPLEQRILQASK